MLTHEDFLKRIYDLVKDEYTILSEYKGYNQRVKIRHNVCGHEYEVKVGNFYKGNRCKKCFMEKHNKKISGNNRSNMKYFKEKVFKLTGNDYTILSDVYINNKTKVKIRHNICGHEYEVRPDLFLGHNTRCPLCANKLRNKNRRINNYLSKLLENASDGHEYKWIGEYKNNNKTKVKIRHNVCGHEYEVRPNDFQQGYRCPICSDMNNSKQSVLIKNIFKNYNDINIEYEVKFKECKLLEQLRFDYKVENFIIEYDGEQHFKYFKNSFMNKDKFSLIRKRDSIKNDFIIKNNFNFIRIPFNLKDEQVEEIILNIIHKNYQNIVKNINKYNLYAKIQNETYNTKSYYENINNDYFNIC